ncbi:hypothetical protein R3P38DRAFT_3172122 [Favolaschia claudopus]|uniref:Uncharacterized protein n=1 Tax=Favolaschia claudopus TaxID=2862362 RepID=A0AAW0DIG8_9AGAR
MSNAAHADAGSFHTLYPRSPAFPTSASGAHTASNSPPIPVLQITPPPPFTPAPLAPDSVTNELFKLHSPRRLVPTPRPYSAAQTRVASRLKSLSPTPIQPLLSRHFPAAIPALSTLLPTTPSLARQSALHHN